MRPIATNEFLENAKSLGIGFDPRYPRSQNLIILPPNEHSRFWIRPEEPSRWPHFVASILDAVGPAGSISVCRYRGGVLRWPSLGTAETQLDRTQAVISTALEIPDNWPGAIEFTNSDRERLIAVMVAHFFDPLADLYGLPVHGRFFVKFSHHDVVHIEASDEKGIEAAISAMAAAKYPLPEELPDSTFKQPKWMKPPNNG